MSSYAALIDKQPTLIKKGSLENTAVIWNGISQEFDTYRTNAEECSSVPVTVDDVTGELLEELIKRITGYTRSLQMTDAQLFKYIPIFFRKNGNVSWATKWSIIDSFSYLLDINYLYLIENWVKTNIITGNNFEDYEAGEKTVQFGDWIPSGSTVSILSDGQFEGSKCLSVTGTGNVYQDVASSAGTYILIVPYTGNGKITVQRTSDGYYWNFSTMVWSSTASSKAVLNSTAYYKIQELFIIFSTDDTAKITFGPAASTDTFIIDYLQYGLKATYPYIKIIYKILSPVGEYVNNWPAGNDPITTKVLGSGSTVLGSGSSVLGRVGLDESNATYLDNDFIFGAGASYPSNFYQKILNDIKPAGVNAEFSFIGED
jgi:hypothetical protein